MSMSRLNSSRPRTSSSGIRRRRTCALWRGNQYICTANGGSASRIWLPTKSAPAMRPAPSRLDDKQSSAQDLSSLTERSLPGAGRSSAAPPRVRECRSEVTACSDLSRMAILDGQERCGLRQFMLLWPVAFAPGCGLYLQPAQKNDSICIARPILDRGDRPS